MVEEECPECRGKEMILAEGCDCDYCKITPGYLPCHSCNGSGTISRPMTVEEVLEDHKRLRDRDKKITEILIAIKKSYQAMADMPILKQCRNYPDLKNVIEVIDDALTLGSGKIKKER
jgi:hypothetical protein